MDLKKKSNGEQNPSTYYEGISLKLKLDALGIFSSTIQSRFYFETENAKEKVRSMKHFLRIKEEVPWDLREKAENKAALKVTLSLIMC